MGTLAAPLSCRDKGLGGVDAGALCLSSSGSRNLAEPHETPTKSCCRQDKHKAPAHPHIRPLSLQDGGTSFPDLVVNIHQDGDDLFRHGCIRVSNITTTPAPTLPPPIPLAY